MKKVLISILIIFILIIIVVTLNISNNVTKMNAISNFNKEFEKFKEKTLYGADVLTIINKAIENNKENNIQRDDEGNFIEDDNYSIKVDLVLLSKDKEENIKETVHPMEKLEKVGLDGFISSFSITKFEFKDIKYNSNGKISKITIKQIEL